MAIKLAQIEDSTLTNYLPPKGEFITFSDEAHYEEKVREWGLSSTREVKREFWFKESTYQRLVTIKGYEEYGQTGEYNTIIIEFQDGNLSCIHPAYLKEMQSPSFVKAYGTEAAPSTTNEKENSITTKVENTSDTVAKPDKTIKKNTDKKTTQPKISLPEDKVHFKAKVKQFALTWNHFNEENDEVIVLENVVIDQEESIEIGLAWCSHSKTLKKFELVPGEMLEFDGKIVKKKLAKGKDIEDEAFLIEEAVPYKINNPSKIKKS